MTSPAQRRQRIQRLWKKREASVVWHIVPRGVASHALFTQPLTKLLQHLPELLCLVQGRPRLHLSPRACVPGGGVPGESLKALGELVDLCGLCEERVGDRLSLAVQALPLRRL